MANSVSVCPPGTPHSLTPLGAGHSVGQLASLRSVSLGWRPLFWKAGPASSSHLVFGSWVLALESEEGCCEAEAGGGAGTFLPQTVVVLPGLFVSASGYARGGRLHAHAQGAAAQSGAPCPAGSLL